MLEKLHILYLYILCFILVLMQYFSVDFSGIIITLIGVSLLPLGKVLRNHFEKMTNYLNIFFDIYAYLVVLTILTAYILSPNPYIFIMFVSYLSIFLVPINTTTTFSYGISVFFLGIFFSALSGDSSWGIYLTFSFYGLIFGIIYHTITSFLQIEKYLRSHSVGIVKTLVVLFSVLFIASLYFSELQALLPQTLLVFLIILNLSFSELKTNISDPNFRLSGHIIVISLFVIIIIPLINDYLMLPLKNEVFIMSSSIFIFFYICMNIYKNKIQRLSLDL